MELKLVAERSVMEKLRKKGEAFVIQRTLGLSFTTEIDETFNNSWEWENEGNIFSPGAATTGGDVDTTVVDLF